MFHTVGNVWNTFKTYSRKIENGPRETVRCAPIGPFTNCAHLSFRHRSQDALRCQIECGVGTDDFGYPNAIVQILHPPFRVFPLRCRPSASPRLKVGSGAPPPPDPPKAGQAGPGRQASGERPALSQHGCHPEGPGAASDLPRTCDKRAVRWAPEVTGATPGVKRQHTHMVEPRASCRRDNQRRRQRGA